MPGQGSVIPKQSPGMLMQFPAVPSEYKEHIEQSRKWHLPTTVLGPVGEGDGESEDVTERDKVVKTGGDEVRVGVGVGVGGTTVDVFVVLCFRWNKSHLENVSLIQDPRRGSLKR